MSSTLTWFIKPKTKSLPDSLKYVLEKRFDLWHEREFSHADIPFLEGLVAGGIVSAEQLIELIEKHDYVYLKLEC